MTEQYPEANKRVRRLALESLRDHDLLGDEAPLRDVSTLGPYEPLEPNDISILPPPRYNTKERTPGVVPDIAGALSDLRAVFPEVARFDWRAHGMVIAGGFIEKILFAKHWNIDYYEHIFASAQISDIDIFLVGHAASPSGAESAREAVRALYKLVQPRVDFVHRTERIVHIVTRDAHPIQIILHRFPSAAAVLASFDIGACCYLYDGHKFWTDMRGALAWERGAIVPDLTIRSERTDHRLTKYVSRNHTLVIPWANPSAKVEWCDIQQFEFANPKFQSYCTHVYITVQDCLLQLIKSNSGFNYFMQTGQLPNEYKIESKDVRFRNNSVIDPVTMDMGKISLSDKEFEMMWYLMKYVYELPHASCTKEDIYKFILNCVQSASLPDMFEKTDNPLTQHPAVQSPKEWIVAHTADDGGATERHGVVVERASAVCAVGALSLIDSGGMLDDCSMPLPLLVVQCFLAEEARLNVLGFWGRFDNSK